VSKRWDSSSNEFKEDKNIDIFIEEISKVCKKYNMSISHEDGHGGFIIERFCADNIEWLKNASFDSQEILEEQS